MAYIPAAEIIWGSENKCCKSQNYFYRQINYKLFSYEGGIVLEVQYSLCFALSATIDNAIIDEAMRLAQQIHLPAQE
ncbi:MAG: hypothetical protein ACRDE8_04015 [Ginsengibacter sp.]